MRQAESLTTMRRRGWRSWDERRLVRCQATQIDAPPPNPKSEIRNPKQKGKSQNGNKRNEEPRTRLAASFCLLGWPGCRPQKHWKTWRAFSLPDFRFEFVSDFGFRISDFPIFSHALSNAGPFRHLA